MLLSSSMCSPLVTKGGSPMTLEEWIDLDVADGSVSFLST